MYLIAGLGNPGERYDLTYHNVGFIVVDAICKHWNFQAFSKKASHLITSGLINKSKVVLLKSLLFMNNSGISVGSIVNFYKIPLDNVIIIHDDADLQFGKTKIKKGGGSAGHNGIKSIDNFIGNNYWRLRIGIGRPKSEKGLANYVLSKFENSSAVIQLAREIATNIESLYPFTTMGKTDER